MNWYLFLDIIMWPTAFISIFVVALAIYADDANTLAKASPFALVSIAYLIARL